MDKKKAAAYARVSTNGKMQAHSYEFQSRYWNERLSNDETYEYVGLFADKGISGKFANRRPQFMALMDACKKGEVDVVFTKSVQRFARNTEEMLTIVRELREIGIAVIFEKENINTLNPDSEIFLTIAAAVAEDDLVRYSDNVSWSIQDRFQRGECIIGPRLYGYEVAKATITTINPEEAKVVKEIFERYATGKSSSREIAAWLNERGIPAALGGKWADNQIRAMLRNEKYKGDMLLQKTFLENGMKKTNRGEKDCYYVENSHEPIVDRELWEKVQTIMDARTNKKLQGQVTKLYPFTGMIICGECGHKYTHKVNNSGLIWQANFWKCHNSITHGVKVCGNSGISSGISNSLFTTNPFSSTVSLVNVPAVAPVFFSTSVIAASSLPSKVVAPVASPVMLIALAVLSFCATCDSATTVSSSAVGIRFHTAVVSDVAISTYTVFSA